VPKRNWHSRSRINFRDIAEVGHEDLAVRQHEEVIVVGADVLALNIDRPPD